jgi:putative addiction module component (TIGR02574 family)
MSPAVEQLKDQIGALPEPERLELALFLLRTLDPAEEGVEAAWQTEVSRRAAEVRAGTARGRPAEEVFRELRERYP